MNKRLFVALPIDDRWTEAYEHYRNQFGSHEWLRWTMPADLHTTLLFLGSIEEELIPEITDALKEIAAIQQPLTLRLEGVVYVPNELKPSMLLLNWKEDLQFNILVGRVREEISFIMNSRMTEKQLPHTMFARFNKRTPPPKILPPLLRVQIDDDHVLFAEMRLMESFPTRDGSKYVILEKFPFGKTRE